MRLWTRYMPLLTVLAALCLQGCQDSDSDGQPIGQESGAVNMALSVAKMSSAGTTGMTRMAEANMTGLAGNIQLLYIKPFIIDEDREIKEITIDDEYESASSIYNLRVVTPAALSNGAVYTSPSTLTPGVNRLLAYAYDNNGTPGPIKGALVTTFYDYDQNQWQTDLQPANIRFQLKPIKKGNEYLGINGDTDVKTIAEELAEYLTSIANAEVTVGGVTKTWKAYATNDANADLKLLFKNFTNQLSDDVGEVLPGSAANVKAWVTELKKTLNGLTSLTGNDVAIKEAIIAAINDKLDNSNPQDWTETSWKGFPASLGLPDGAAVVRWDGEKFVPETQTTTVADINNLERFTYPAEIYYYGNSHTMVSSEDLSGNFSSKSKWEKDPNNGSDTDYVLDRFEEKEVDAFTKTVAMKEPLQYGVAQLLVALNKTETSSLKDSKNADIDVDTDNPKKFKLTGIIVGGQLPVGFDFTPGSAMQGYSEEKMSFIYDNQVQTNGSGEDKNFYLSSTADATNVIQTLVLQSYNGQNVKFVLELENNSDKDFEGLNGTVYRGTKFYLVGEIDYTQYEEDATIPADVKTRVFTQDYTTTVGVTVSTLAKAYNVLPNLMSPRLEMGIELTPKWEQATTTDVIL